MSKEAEPFDVEGLRRTASIVDAYHLCESSDKIVAAADHIEALEKAAHEFRDAVLHDRYQLAEMGMDSDKTNAVLDLFDDTIGRYLTHEEPTQ